MKRNKTASMCRGLAGALVLLCALAGPALARDGQPTRQERLISSWILTGDPYYARLAGLSEAQIAKVQAARRIGPPLR